MDADALRQLKALEQVSANSTITQRSLAKELGVALGLANLMIRRLVTKGHLKIVSLQRNRIQYLLTSKGLAEKTRLTYEYLEYSLHLYRSVREILRVNLRRLAETGGCRVVIFGTGEIAEIAYLTMRQLGLELAAVVDDEQAGGAFLGHPVIAAQQLSQIAYDCGIVASVSQDGNGLYERLQQMGILPEQLIRIEQQGPVIRAVGPGLLEGAAR